MNKSYFVYLLHCATGEGMTHAIGQVIAETEEEATKAFVSRHMGSDEHTIKYFSQGVVIMDLTDKSTHDEVREILSSFFASNTIEYLLAAEKDNSLHEFYFKSYINYS